MKVIGMNVFETECRLCCPPSFLLFLFPIAFSDLVIHCQNTFTSAYFRHRGDFISSWFGG